MTAYERVRTVVGELDRRFYALLDACDDYAELLDVLADEERASEEPNAELVRRFGHQHKQVSELRDGIEGEPMEIFLRIIDRLSMIEATEQGRFL